MKELGTKIKDIRVSLKISQGDFAKELNISRSGIAQIEAGKTNPSFELIYKIVKLYNITPGFFFEDFKLEIDDVQVKIPINVQDNDKIDAIRHDLKILNEISWFPSIDEILPYLSNSDARNRAILKDLKLDLKERLKTYNALADIAGVLKINSVLDNAKEFEKVDDAKYIKDSLADYLPEEYRDGLKFDNPILNTIVGIIAIKESVEHIDYSISARVDRLTKDCKWLIKYGHLTVKMK